MLDCPRSTPVMQPTQPSRKAHANKKSAARCPWSIHSAPQRRPRTPMRPIEPPPPLRLEALPSYCRHYVLSDSYVLCFEQIRAVFTASPLLSHRFTKPRGEGVCHTLILPTDTPRKAIPPSKKSRRTRLERPASPSVAPDFPQTAQPWPPCWRSAAASATAKAAGEAATPACAPARKWQTASYR